MIISNLEIKTSKFGEYKSFEVEGKKASAFLNQTNKDWYNTITEGADIEGILTQNDKGYWNLKAKLEPPAFVKRGNDIKQAMESKREAISQAQDNKEYAVRLSATFRDATLVSVELMKNAMAEKQTNFSFKEEWVKLRKWLWEHYEVTDGQRKDLTSDGGELPPF